MCSADRVVYTLCKCDMCVDAERYRAVIDCKWIGSEHSLFSAFVTALRFPPYFGWNWNALDDCLSDLEWISSVYICVVFKNFDCIINARKLSKKIGLLLQIIADACYDSSCDNQAIIDQKIIAFDFEVSKDNALATEELFNKQRIKPQKKVVQTIGDCR